MPWIVELPRSVGLCAAQRSRTGRCAISPLTAAMHLSAAEALTSRVTLQTLRSVHVPHHVSSKIPWYNLRKANDSLRQNWGEVRTLTTGDADLRSGFCNVPVGGCNSMRGNQSAAACSLWQLGN